MPDPATPVKIEPAAPAAVESPAPAAVTSPEPAKVVEVAKVEALSPTPVTKVEEVAPPVTPPPPKSLLAEAGKDAPKPAEAKPTPTAEPAPAPAESAITYEPFKLPEGFEVDEKDMTDFTGVLKEFKAPQELGQKIMDLYSREITKLAEFQQAQWQKTLETWKNDVMADPLLGGNRFETVLTRCGSVLNEFADQDFREMLNVSGIGNHPAMFRFLNKVAEFVSEPKPVMAQKPAPQPKPSRAQRRYGANGAAQPTG